MRRRLRRNTEIAEIQMGERKFAGLTITIAKATTNNGVSFVSFTIKSDSEPKNDPQLAATVLNGRLEKALDQYRSERGKVTVKLTTLIPKRKS